MKISKKRLAVWNKSKGFCWYCGCDIPLESRWHQDHCEPVHRISAFLDVAGKRKLIATGEFHRPHNDTEENLVPSCAPCNNFKMTFSVEEFRSELEAQIERARKSSVNFRNCERLSMATKAWRLNLKLPSKWLLLKMPALIFCCLCRTR